RTDAAASLSPGRVASDAPPNFSARSLVRRHGKIQNSRRPRMRDSPASEETDQGPQVSMLMVHNWGCGRGRVGSVDYQAKSDQMGVAVCDRHGTTIMGGFERTRPAARYRGNRALFLLLASGCNLREDRRGA